MADGKIWGSGVEPRNGGETSVLTATVKDAHDNILANETVTWGTTLGTLTAASSQTDANGQATIDLSAVHTATTNGTATVTATVSAGNKTADITVRAVILAGGKYYWTMTSDHSSAVEATAQSLCATYGGGSAANRADLTSFVSGGGNFANMSVSGEYTEYWHFFAGTWNATSGMFSSAGYQGSTLGNTYSGALSGGYYVCVK